MCDALSLELAQNYLHLLRLRSRLPQTQVLDGCQPISSYNSILVERLESVAESACMAGTPSQDSRGHLSVGLELACNLQEAFKALTASETTSSLVTIFAVVEFEGQTQRSSAACVDITSSGVVGGVAVLSDCLSFDVGQYFAASLLKISLWAKSGPPVSHSLPRGATSAVQDAWTACGSAWLHLSDCLTAQSKLQGLLAAHQARRTANQVPNVTAHSALTPPRLAMPPGQQRSSTEPRSLFSAMLRQIEAGASQGNAETSFARAASRSSPVPRVSASRRPPPAEHGGESSTSDGSTGTDPDTDDEDSTVHSSESPTLHEVTLRHILAVASAEGKEEEGGARGGQAAPAPVAAAEGSASLETRSRPVRQASERRLPLRSLSQVRRNISAPPVPTSSSEGASSSSLQAPLLPPLSHQNVRCMKQAWLSPNGVAGMSCTPTSHPTGDSPWWWELAPRERGKASFTRSRPLGSAAAHSHPFSAHSDRPSIRIWARFTPGSTVNKSNSGGVAGAHSAAAASSVWASAVPEGPPGNPAEEWSYHASGSRPAASPMPDSLCAFARGCFPMVPAGGPGLPTDYSQTLNTCLQYSLSQSLWSPLHAAASAGHAAAVLKCIASVGKQWAYLRTADGRGLTVLDVAALFGHENVVAAIVASNADDSGVRRVGRGWDVDLSAFEGVDSTEVAFATPASQSKLAFSPGTALPAGTPSMLSSIKSGLGLPPSPAASGVRPKFAHVLWQRVDHVHAPHAARATSDWSNCDPPAADTITSNEARMVAGMSCPGACSTAPLVMEWLQWSAAEQFDRMAALQSAPGSPGLKAALFRTSARSDLSKALVQVWAAPVELCGALQAQPTCPVPAGIQARLSAISDGSVPEWLPWYGRHAIHHAVAGGSLPTMRAIFLAATRADVARFAAMQAEQRRADGGVQSVDATEVNPVDMSAVLNLQDGHGRSCLALAAAFGGDAAPGVVGGALAAAYGPFPYAVPSKQSPAGREACLGGVYAAPDVVGARPPQVPSSLLLNSQRVYLSMSRVLLMGGADCGLPDVIGETPLMHALRTRNALGAMLLLCVARQSELPAVNDDDDAAAGVAAAATDGDGSSAISSAGEVLPPIASKPQGGASSHGGSQGRLMSWCCRPSAFSRRGMTAAWLAAQACPSPPSVLLNALEALSTPPAALKLQHSSSSGTHSSTGSNAERTARQSLHRVCDGFVDMAASDAGLLRQCAHSGIAHVLQTAVDKLAGAGSSSAGKNATVAAAGLLSDWASAGLLALLEACEEGSPTSTQPLCPSAPLALLLARGAPFVEPDAVSGATPAHAAASVGAISALRQLSGVPLLPIPLLLLAQLGMPHQGGSTARLDATRGGAHSDHPAAARYDTVQGRRPKDSGGSAASDRKNFAMPEAPVGFMGRAKAVLRTLGSWGSSIESTPPDHDTAPPLKEPAASKAGTSAGISVNPVEAGELTAHGLTGSASSALQDALISSLRNFLKTKPDSGERGGAVGKGAESAAALHQAAEDEQTFCLRRFWQACLTEWGRSPSRTTTGLDTAAPALRPGALLQAGVHAQSSAAKAKVQSFGTHGGLQASIASLHTAVRPSDSAAPVAHLLNHTRGAATIHKAGFATLSTEWLLLDALCCVPAASTKGSIVRSSVPMHSSRAAGLGNLVQPLCSRRPNRMKGRRAADADQLVLPVGALQAAMSQAGVSPDLCKQAVKPISSWSEEQRARQVLITIQGVHKVANEHFVQLFRGSVLNSIGLELALRAVGEAAQWSSQAGQRVKPKLSQLAGEGETSCVVESSSHLVQRLAAVVDCVDGCGFTPRATAEHHGHSTAAVFLHALEKTIVALEDSSAALPPITEALSGAGDMASAGGDSVDDWGTLVLEEEYSIEALGDA